MTLLISPTEPPPIRNLGITSSEPETYGADILWYSSMGTVGIQRKQFPEDFISSIRDGRLAKEYGQMKGLDLPILVLEGRPNFTPEGNLFHERHHWTLQQHHNYLASVQLRGIHVHQVNSIQETPQFVRGMQMWTNKPDHTGLETRPAANDSPWGKEGRIREQQLWLIQGLPGTGPKRAKAVLDTVGFPFGLKVRKDDLLAVNGIGHGWMKKVLEVLEEEV